MKNIVQFFSIFLIVFTISSCGDDPTENIPTSPFEKFLGVWQLETELINGVETDVESQIMTIEEDNNQTDLRATGYHETGNPSIRTEMSFELTEVENEIIMRKGPITFFCTYSFGSDNRLELDDTFENDVVISTWVKL